LIGLIATYTAPAIASAEGPETSRERIVLLSNAQVLRGDVILYGNRYLITQANSELRIPIESVEKICHDLDEAYLHLNHKIRFGSALDHLMLAQWCLDENLQDQAQKQLDLAIVKRPDHPRIPLIRRQLESQGPLIDSATESFKQPAQSPEDLEALVSEMPHGTMESFTRMVQPLLLNGCAARACHGIAGGNDFLLYRFQHRQNLPRRATLRNLQAVMEWVDRTHAAESPLLHYATTAHGVKTEFANNNNNSPPLKPSGIPLQRLSRWVAELAQNKPSPAAATSPTQSLAGVPAVLESQGPAGELSLHNHSGPDTKTSFDLLSEKVPTGSEKSPAFRPRDPFDPEIFNRRHHPKKR
jgi:hypothetical protein